MLKVVGGKGGFGSNLRSIQIEKTSNNEACRDLSGRRLRDINCEKKMKNWVEKKKNEVKENPEAIFKRKIEKLQAKPKVEVERIKEADLHEAVEKGLKRRAEKSPLKKNKKIKGAVWIDDISSASDSEED